MDQYCEKIFCRQQRLLSSTVPFSDLHFKIKKKKILQLHEIICRGIWAAVSYYYTEIQCKHFSNFMTDAKESLVTISPRPVLTLISSKRLALLQPQSGPISSFLHQISCPHLSEEEPLLTWLSSFNCLSFMVSSSKALLRNMKALREKILFKTPSVLSFRVANYSFGPSGASRVYSQGSAGLHGLPSLTAGGPATLHATRSRDLTRLDTLRVRKGRTQTPGCLTRIFFSLKSCTEYSICSRHRHRVKYFKCILLFIPQSSPMN